nr:MAG TPA: hypothetical protein [Caudoviricetes sp.]
MQRELRLLLCTDYLPYAFRRSKVLSSVQCSRWT